MELKDMETKDLIQLYSMSIKELKNRGVIRTNNVVGELGEYLAIEYYNNTPSLPNLVLAPIGTENIDAISRKGDRYSIKSTSKNVTGVFYGLQEKDSLIEDERMFEYVIICKFDDNYGLQKILEMDWNAFQRNKKWHNRMKAWNLTLSKALYNECKVIFDKKM